MRWLIRLDSRSEKAIVNSEKYFSLFNTNNGSKSYVTKQQTQRPQEQEEQKDNYSNYLGKKKEILSKL